MAILYVKDAHGNKIPIPAIVGKDGVSPAVSISKDGGTTTITITDAQGVHTAIIEDGLDASQGGALPVPETAAVGQYIVVSAVDANGVVTATEAVDMPSSGGNYLPGENVFAGKKASFYGDSLTEENYHYSKGYHKWVSEILGLASYDNYGVSGYKVSDVYNKVSSATDTADIVFVMCGVNDQTFSVPLGTFGDATADTTYGALHLLCDLLKQKYPTSIIVFITPHYQTNYPHSDGVTSYEVSKAIREVCGKYAIPVYDNFVLSGIYSTNLSAYTTDNCHWNDAAHAMVGKNLARFVAETFRYVYGDSSGGNGGDSSGDEGGDTNAHNYTETVTTAATCTTIGVKTFTCSECGESYTEMIPATGHNYVGGICTVCGHDTPSMGANTEITGTYSNNQFHISMYVAAEDLLRIENEQPIFGFTIEPITAFTPTPENTGGVYEVDSANDLSAGYTAVSGASSFKKASVEDKGDGTYNVMMTQTACNHAASRRFWCFPICMKLTAGDKFNLRNAYVQIGGRSVKVYAVAGAFAKETFTSEGV